ncbi:MAG TPA: DUF3943 domain-containing protein [Anaeromyxobacter sp.]|nr:DUF3943 domain-containing protein [Anaeromyxobacter sp.]
MPNPTLRRRPSPARRFAALAAAAALVAGRAAAAEPPDLTPTFRYEAPAGAHRLRAAAEIGGFLALGGVAWLFAPSRTAAPGSKADGVRLDANPFRTNFAGHPISGAIYYELARSNRLSAAESALWSVAGSTVWEAVEYTEPASLNDLVVTPVAGVALGAPLFELAAHLDRGPRTTAREVLAWILAPPKKAHDLLDGARPARGAPGDALEASSGASAGATRAGGEWRGELRAHAAFRLVRDPRWGAPGEGTEVLRDAAVTGLSLDLALSSSGLADLSFGSWVHLAAVHRRALAEDGAALRGTESLAGAGAGFAVRMHDWGLGALDRLAVAELPALAAEGRWRSGALRLSARISAAPTFGGVASPALARDPDAVPPEDVPTVQSAWHYHFAVGAALAPSIELAWGRVALEASGRADWLWGVTEPDADPARSPAAHFLDRWVDGRIGARVAVARSVELSASATRRVRRSEANQASLDVADTSFAAGLAWRP